MLKKNKGKTDKAPLLFNGKPFELHHPAPALVKLKEILDSLQGKGVFSPRELKNTHNISRSTVSAFTSEEKFKTYCHRFGGRGTGGEVALGHPNEIKRFIQCLKDGGVE